MENIRYNIKCNTTQKNTVFTVFLLAGDERIELPPKVLETPIIPFDQSPIYKMTYQIRHLFYFFLMQKSIGLLPYFWYLQNFIQNSDFFWSSPRSISNSQLHMLPCFHLCPIYLVLFKGSYSLMWGISHLEGGFTLRCLQRLSLPDLATLPCRWSTADTPVVRPSRSSRTKDSSSQISSARAG